MPDEKPKKPKKPARELTTAEALRRLFPKEVRDEAKRAAGESRKSIPPDQP